MRTELGNRMIGAGTNALASSIILVCRQRPADAPTISRREFLRELNAVLPEALDEMTKGSGDDRSPVAPVDLSQAIIGPGMAVFSNAAVLEATARHERHRPPAHQPLLAEDDFDPDAVLPPLVRAARLGAGRSATPTPSPALRAPAWTACAMRAWSSGGIAPAQVVRIPTDWDPQTDTDGLGSPASPHPRPGAGGRNRRGSSLAAVKGKAEAARQLAYRLYTLCERQGWAEDARAYNELITSWTGIESAAGESPGQSQLDLFGGTQ
jgi:putative DNA methylase